MLLKVLMFFSESDKNNNQIDFAIEAKLLKDFEFKNRVFLGDSEAGITINN